MTLKYDLEPHQHIGTPILHLWLKFGGNWCLTVPAGAIFSRWPWNVWPWTSPTYGHSHIACMFQVWWQLVFNCSCRSNFWSVTLKCDLEPHQHMGTRILYPWPKFGGNWCSTDPARAILGQWPWNVTLNFTNIWALPYCMYVSSLVAIGVQLFLQEQFRANDLEIGLVPP